MIDNEYYWTTLVMTLFSFVYIGYRLDCFVKAGILTQPEDKGEGPESFICMIATSTLGFFLAIMTFAGMLELWLVFAANLVYLFAVCLLDDNKPEDFNKYRASSRKGLSWITGIYLAVIIIPIIEYLF